MILQYVYVFTFIMQSFKIILYYVNWMFCLFCGEWITLQKTSVERERESVQPLVQSVQKEQSHSMNFSILSWVASLVKMHHHHLL